MAKARRALLVGNDARRVADALLAVACRRGARAGGFPQQATTSASHRATLHPRSGGRRIARLNNNMCTPQWREEIMLASILVRTSAAAAAAFTLGLGAAQAAPFMIVGNDEKLLWDDNF